MKYLATAAGISALTISLLAQADIEPARFRSGAAPVVPVMMTAGGDVIVSLAVSSGGAVTDVDVLRSRRSALNKINGILQQEFLPKTERVPNWPICTLAKKIFHKNTL